jgi:transposase
MTVYIGVDFHARKQMVSYLTTEDGEIQQIELLHGQDDLRAFYARLGSLDQVVVGFESSGYAAWFEEMLEELGCEIWIGHAAQIRKCARRRQKNDRRDADLILELMLRGDFPRIHRYSRQNREVLQQLRYRQRLVKMRTMVINSLRFMATSRGVTLRGKLQSQRGQERLLALALPTPLDQQRNELCRLLCELQQKIETVEKCLGETAELDQRVQQLRTHPGIGLLTGLCLVHTLSSIERFANARKVTAYVGTITDMKRIGHIESSKRSNSPSAAISNTFDSIEERAARFILYLQ